MAIIDPSDEQMKFSSASRSQELVHFNGFSIDQDKFLVKDDVIVLCSAESAESGAG